MRIWNVLLACVALGLALARAQSPAFEVASIKAISVPPVLPGGARPTESARSGGPGTSDPSRMHFPFASIKTLVEYAYNIEPRQLSAPDSLDNYHFEIDARVNAGATPEQARAMMQTLLAQRFHLAIHRESKELSGYALTVAKSGLKMKAAMPGRPLASPAPDRSAARKRDPLDIPNRPMPAPGETSVSMTPGRIRFYGSAIATSELAARLSRMIARPVTDATGLTAKYDVVLTFSSESLPGGMPARPRSSDGGADNGAASAGEQPQDLFAAVQSQLGLRLESKKAQVEVIVVDHADKVPTGN